MVDVPISATGYAGNLPSTVYTVPAGKHAVVNIHAAGFSSYNLTNVVGQLTVGDFTFEIPNSNFGGDDGSSSGALQATDLRPHRDKDQFTANGFTMRLTGIVLTAGQSVQVSTISGGSSSSNAYVTGFESDNA